MAGRETGNPKSVPTATEDEKLAPNGLNGIGQQGDIDTWPE